jgi:phosphate transport system substrate-binding protein
MKTLQIAMFMSLASALGCGQSGGSAPSGEATSPADQAKAAAPAEKVEATPKPAAVENIDMQGAGATFPYPLYSKWVAEYQKVDPRVRINYQSIGSGGGIRQITEKTVDFGASDAPMNAEEIAKTGGKIVHIPTTLGAVVVAYNLPGVSGLAFSPEVVAGIFLGEIKTWNDKKIAKLNPGAKLPKDAITIAYRSDGSGTTAVFTDYLSKVSAAWKEKVGAGKSVKFPVGLGAKGNEGVAGQLKTTPGSLGYVELAYAKQTDITFAKLENHAHKVVEPSLEAISAAAASVSGSMPEDLRVSITDAPGDAAYPISAFTYILVYEDQTNATKGKALAEFLWWAVHQGQSLGPALHYATLPAEVVAKVEAKLRGLKGAGQPLLPSS